MLAICNDPDVQVPINGVVYPQWAVGFAQPFRERIGVHFADDRIVRVEGQGQSQGNGPAYAPGRAGH